MQQHGGVAGGGGQLVAVLYVAKGGHRGGGALQTVVTLKCVMDKPMARFHPSYRWKKKLWCAEQCALILKDLKEVPYRGRVAKMAYLSEKIPIRIALFPNVLFFVHSGSRQDPMN